jgi:hypothetical protein
MYRYSIKEDFGIQKSIEDLDRTETSIKEKQSALNKKEQEKREENKKDIDALKKDIGESKDNYRTILRQVKSTIGGELFNRFIKGFVRTKDNVEENERINDSEFLFKKLKF